METKQCSSCKIIKAVVDFQPTARYKSGLSSQCRTCRYASTKVWREHNKERIRASNRVWRQNHPEVVRNLKRLYRQRYPEQAKAQVLAAYKKNWPKYRAQRWRKWLKTKYGITEPQFDLLVRKQKGKCAICKNGQRQGPRRPKLCVDHKAGTKVPRGLLCFQCNVMLGSARDSIKILRAAVRYLQKGGTF